MWEYAIDINESSCPHSSVEFPHMNPILGQLLDGRAAKELTNLER